MSADNHDVEMRRWADIAIARQKELDELRALIEQVLLALDVYYHGYNPDREPGYAGKTARRAFEAARKIGPWQ